MHIVPSLPFFLSVSFFSLHLLPPPHQTFIPLRFIPGPLFLPFFTVSCLSLPFLPLPFPLSCLQGDLSQSSVVLEGQVERGHFGTSVVNLGDIDDDSREGV